jgi:hypothetical protein
MQLPVIVLNIFFMLVAAFVIYIAASFIIARFVKGGRITSPKPVKALENDGHSKLARPKFIILNNSNRQDFIS